MQGWQLRERRRSAGLTLRDVARAAGISPTNLSAYERRTRQPGRPMVSRLLAVIDAGADSPVHRMSLLTAPATAAALRHGLRAGWPTADLLRLVREMRSNAKFAVSDADRAAFFAEPSTTADPRWDAMLAGIVEELALRAGDPLPPWTRGHALPEFWFVSPMSSMQAYAFSHSPFSLQVRGVMVDPADLEAV